MKKVISFSLWGQKPIYNIGAIKNAKLALDYYPDFECWFYIHRETVPQYTIECLNKLQNTKIIYKSGNLSNLKPTTWRFESIDHPNVEINISRDTDTRILLREKLAVDEWIKSNKTLHIMRDHPHHDFLILAGMFGIKKTHKIYSWNKLINDYNININSHFYDQNFLANIIYPILKNDVLIHSSFHKYENEIVKPFPIPYCDKYLFVGGYVYEDDTVSLRHIQFLKNALKITSK